MEIIRDLKENKNLSLALGFFDGVHPAHKTVLRVAKKNAIHKGVKAAVITFKEHPLCVLQNRKPQYILSLEQRLKRIEKEGIDFVYLLDFEEKLAHLSPKEYLSDILIRNFSPEFITTGFNHTFGYKKEGTADFLKKEGENCGYKYFEILPIYQDGVLVSSTNIRKNLVEGNIKTASSLLGYDFYIENKVERGLGLARTLGFKTANLSYPKGIIEVKQGVYKGSVFLDKEYPALINWGLRPSVDQNQKPILEAHIIGYEGDLYGKNIRVCFCDFLRNQIKFNTLDELKAQIEKDYQNVILK